MAPKLIAALLQVAGLVAVTVAAALVSVPLGVFTAGVSLLALGLSIERSA